MVTFICTLLLLAACLSLGDDSNGAWGSLTDSALASDPYARYYKWRGPDKQHELDNITATTVRFSNESPCRALTMRDNCFSRNPNRAEALLRRVFKTKGGGDPDLSEGSLLKTLSILQNKLIVFAGDSTMASVYASVVCHLSQFTKTMYNFKWMYDREMLITDENKQNKCPNDLSCHLMGGDSYFASHNVTFRFIQFDTFRSGRGNGTLQPLLAGDMHSDVTVMNFGGHYTDDEMFRDDLLWFLHDAVKLARHQTKEGSAVTPWYWLESFPRHYINASRTAQSHLDVTCAPITDKSLYYKADWRNRLVDSKLPDFKNEGRLISVAKELYDQWDAHVDYGDSSRTEVHMDCTRYCVGSGVFRYVVSKVINALNSSVPESGEPPTKNFLATADLPVPGVVVKPVAKKRLAHCTSTPPVKPGGMAPVGSRQQKPTHLTRGKNDASCK